MLKSTLLRAALPVALIGVLAVTSACTSEPDYYDSKARMRIDGEDASGHHRNNSYRDPNPRYEPNDDAKGDSGDYYNSNGTRINGTRDDGRRYMNESRQDREDRVEQRIANLHDALQITPAQEGEWNDVANIMRQNEAETHRLLRYHMENRSNMNAVDDFKSYERVASSHAEGLRAIIPAFENLYSTMSPAQQENADRVFNTYKGQWVKGGHMMKRDGKGPKVYKKVQ